jgi:hypothetical protein
VSLSLAPELVEPFVAGLLGVCDVDGGVTEEQLAVLQAIVTQVWRRPDLDLRGMSPIEPTEIAGVIGSTDDRRHFQELIVTLEACRHPLTDAQLERAEAYEAAIGITGPDAALFRTMVDEGTERAKADFARFLVGSVEARVEPSLREVVVPEGSAEPELVARIERLRSCAPGTLGHAYVEFYEIVGLPFPGVEATPMNHLNHFYVGHDMTHVISGMGTTAEAEVALSAFLMAMSDDSVNRSALLASLIVHEAGFGDSNKVKAEQGILARPGAAELLAAEIARGGECRADFSRVDHFAMVDRPLADIRAEFGVLTPANTNDGHHLFW